MSAGSMLPRAARMQRILPVLARVLLLGGGVVTGSAGCSAPVRASADWERGVDLSPSKTFSVGRSAELPEHLTPAQEQLVQIVDDTIKRELARKGYREVPRPTAQLVATSHFASRERTNVNTYTCHNYWQDAMYEGAVLPGGAVQACQESELTKFEEGVLMIDVYDTERKELVWHGWATARRPAPGAAATPELVQQATLDILERFPP
jgi:hypothetical protein